MRSAIMGGLVVGLALVLASCEGGVGGSALQPVSLAYTASTPAAGTTLRQPRLPGTVARLYRDGKLLWHDAQGRPTGKGKKLYDILSAASGHGLRPDSYLPTDLLAEGELTRSDAARARLVDQTLSLGLYTFAGDLKFGRFNPNRPSSVTVFQSAVTARDLSAWVRANAPQGKSYRDLASRLRNGALSPEQRSTLAVNMERLRWLTESSYSGPSIRVNVADAILETFHNGRRQDTMRVVVGRAARQTPQLTDPIRDLKFSPDWTVPPTIIEKDFLPRLRNNPNAFGSQYTVRVNGRPASQVRNWGAVRASDVTITRASSSAGPLGGVRFSMYNSGAIFLHDTPARDLFEREFRAYSSGCVRVQRAHDLASWIMSHQTPRMSREEVSARMAAGQTTTVPLTKLINVNLRYLTAYVDGSGRLRFAPDPYRLDAPLAARMGLKIARVRATAPILPTQYDISP